MHVAFAWLVLGLTHAPCFSRRALLLSAVPLPVAATSLDAPVTRRDGFLEEMRDTDAARSLGLPRSEQAREEKLQLLEDEALERCRAAGKREFEQCYTRFVRMSSNILYQVEGCGLPCLSATLTCTVLAGFFSERAQGIAGGYAA